MTAPATALQPGQPPALLRGSLVFASAYVAGLGVSLLGSALLVRVASQPDVASYVMFLQAVTVLGLTLQLGLGSTLQRFLPLARGRGGAAAAATLRRRVAGVQIAIWAVVLPPLVATWPALSRRLGAPELGGVALLLAATGAASSLSRSLGGYLRALRHYAAAAVLEHLAPRALLAIGLGAFFLSGQRVSWLALAALFSACVAASLAAQVLAVSRTAKAESHGPGQAQPSPPVRDIARMSLVVGAQVVAATLLVSVDLWALSVARSHHEVAVYGMMLSLLQVVTVGSVAAQFVVPQEFSRLHLEGRREELEELARTSATATLLFAALAATVLVAIGRPLIATLLGAEYVAGWGFLLVLLVGRLWDAASGPAGSLLLMTGHHLRVTLTSLAATAMTVVLAVALAPRFGGYGVAAATSAGLVAVNVANVASARRLLDVRVTARLTLAAHRRVLLGLVPRLGRTS